ncbi:hypothetical protein FACUT_3645 [Fusarium acutatum]|uniref:Secreted protein n=1 Tax=Fusarium acutatum TaxID=78861 RepID=A0A8H4JW52_9HYPO|nr:hypothetical protein FACUT_3645 [Fusarium acutatum]
MLSSNVLSALVLFAACYRSHINYHREPTETETTDIATTTAIVEESATTTAIIEDSTTTDIPITIIAGPIASLRFPAISIPPSDDRRQ